MPWCSHKVPWSDHPCSACVAEDDAEDTIDVDDAIDVFENLRDAIVDCGREYPHDPIELGMRLWTSRARMWLDHHSYAAELGGEA